MQDTHAITIAQVALEQQKLHAQFDLARQEIADTGRGRAATLLQISAMSR
jgi:hypothetical protein